MLKRSRAGNGKGCPFHYGNYITDRAHKFSLNIAFNHFGRRFVGTVHDSSLCLPASSGRAVVPADGMSRRDKRRRITPLAAENPLWWEQGLMDFANSCYSDFPN